MNNRLLPCALALAVASPPPAMAESFGDLGQALTILALHALAYLALIVTLVVLLVRRNWRALGWVAGLAALVIVIFPLLDTALLKYQQSRVAGAEIRKGAPDLTQRSILYISPSDRCSRSLCEAMIRLHGDAALYALTPDSVRERDFTRPIDLSRVALRRYVFDAQSHSYILQTPAPSEPRPVFDYVIVERRPYYRSRRSNIERALPQMPTRTALGDMLVVETLAAPISSGTLDFARLTPDYLSFYIPRDAFLVPLFVENTTYGTRLDYARARAAWFCASAATDDPRYSCANSLNL